MLTDAVAALPERLRRVVVGYFFEERSMQDLADELGVSESRVSQLRAEALLLLKDGMNSQLDPDQLAPGTASERPGRPAQGCVLRVGRTRLGADVTACRKRARPSTTRSRPARPASAHRSRSNSQAQR